MKKRWIVAAVAVTALTGCALGMRAAERENLLAAALGKATGRAGKEDGPTAVFVARKACPRKEAMMVPSITQLAVVVSLWVLAIARGQGRESTK